MRRYDAPGNITREIAKLNRIRRANPALHSHLGLRFYNAFNDQIISTQTRAVWRRNDSVAVSLDPHRTQETAIEIPLWEWDYRTAVRCWPDLMRERSFIWTGKQQRIRLDPDDLPFAIWRISPCAGV